MKEMKRKSAVVTVATAMSAALVLSPVATVHAVDTDTAIEQQTEAIEIRENAPPITLPQELMGNEGQVLQDIPLPDGWIWADGTTVISKEKRSYLASLIVDDKAYDYSQTAGYHPEEHYVERAVPVKVLTGVAKAKTAIHTPVLRAGAPDTDVTASFPDANFKQYLLDNFDNNKDGKLTISEVESIVDIQIADRTDITDLSGLNLLTNLVTLKCDGSGITSLDVSSNAKLTYLNCSRTGIQTLDVSNNTNLQFLYCSNTRIQTLNVQSNGNLIELNCSSTGITSLDVSSNTKLTYLGCSKTGIQTLDVSSNTAMTHLDCSVTGIQVLDVSGNDKLTTLSCFSTGIQNLDVISNAKLTYLDCSDTGIQTLDVSNNTDLKELYCSSTEIKTLDVSSNVALTTLFCSDIKIQTLDVSSNAALTILFCSGTEIQTLDVSSNTLLKELYCSNTGIQALDVSGNPSLEKLYCTGTTLAWMNVGSNANLKHRNIPMPTTNLGITTTTFNIKDKFRGIDPQKVTITGNGFINNVTGEVSGYDLSRPMTYQYDCGTANGQSVTLDVTVNFVKSDSTIAIIENLDSTYTGKPIPTPTVDKTGSTGNVTFTYEVWNGNVWELFTDIPVNVGKYRIQAHLAEDDFNNGAQSDKKEFTISKAVNSWTDKPAITGWTYGEKANAPTATAKFGNVTFTYSDSKDGTFSDVIPVDVGTWYMKAAVAGTDNFTRLESIQDFTITPKNVANNKDITISDINNDKDAENLVVKDGGMELVKGIQYDVEMKQDGNKTTVTITFKGNYTGMVTKSYTVDDKKPSGDTKNDMNNAVQTGDTTSAVLWVALMAFAAAIAALLKGKKRRNES